MRGVMGVQQEVMGTEVSRELLPRVSGGLVESQRYACRRMYVCYIGV